MVANLNTMVIYCKILILDILGTVINYRGIFIALAPGPNVTRLFYDRNLQKFIKR